MILGLKPVQLVRFANARDPASGRTVRTVASTVTIQASVQPLTDRQREVLPEGLRQSVTRRMWTRSEVLTADQLTGRLADRITINNEEFDVVRVSHWPSLLSHYEADLVRVSEEDEA